MFDSPREEIRAQFLHLLAHLSSYLIIISEVLSFEMILHCSKEVELVRCKKVQTVWWMDG
jgi:hypothetical protein